MPLMTFNIASKTFEEISKLVERGSYSGLDQFLEVAALNQLALERGVSPDELKAKGHRDAPSPSTDRKGARVIRSSVAGPARGGNGKGAASGRAPVARRKATPSAIPDEDGSPLK